ncbi:MAG: AMP-binding protein [Candidatus Omnitrophica bacterium]|nr:AMP-binding protein [Candidatus Omnitrophota bacterium]
MRKISLKNVTIIELLVAINRRYSEKVALQIKEDGKFRSISYIELGRRTSDVAYHLKGLGVERGDRVAILSESKPEWAIAFFGIVSCAGIVVPLDIKLSDAEIEFILNHCEAKVIFVSKQFIRRIGDLKPKLKYLKYIISLDEVENKDILLLKEFKVPPTEIAHREVFPEETALIVYTSGTTGTAKGVELTYKNLLFEVVSLHDFIQFNKDDNFLSILPLNHMLEITGGFLGPLYVGATITYCESLKPTHIISLMQETKTTVMLCVPLVLKMFHDSIMKKIKNLPKFKYYFTIFLLNLSRFLLKSNIRCGKLFFPSLHKQFGGHLRCFVSGGAPLDREVEMNFNAFGFNILQGYGLTETSPVVSVNTFRERKYGSVGKPLKGVEVKILTNNETGTKEGEILVHGLNVMKGYFKNSQKTEEAIRDGWFYTGDLGYLDKDGFLYITGRIKNLIVLGAGKKVHPEEVEEVISKTPYIKEICVLGRVAKRGLRKGCEEVYAVVVPNLEQFDVDKRKNLEFIKEKISYEIERLSKDLAEYKRIMDFEISLEELPKTSTRKIKRKLLIDRINKKVFKEETFIEAFEAKQDSLFYELQGIISELTGLAKERINLYSNLYNDLGIDSLMKVELLYAIERKFGFKIPDEIAYEIGTVSDIFRFIDEYNQGRSDLIEIKDSEILYLLKENKFLKITRFIFYCFFKMLHMFYFRVKTCGKEFLPKEKSFIIASNHTSLLDFPIIFCSLPYKKTKDVIALAAKDYFYTKPLRRIFVELAFNSFPFERMGNFLRGLKICAKLLEKEKSIILFPEGTRSIKGVLQGFKPGVGSLAFDLNIPIVPVYIEGAYKALPKGRIFPRPYKIKVYFGKPIYIDKYKQLEDKMLNYQIYEKITQDLRDEVIKLKEKV